MIRIARNNNGIGGNRALPRRHGRTCTLPDVNDRRLFENRYAERLRGPRLADAQIQWMQVAIAPVQQGTDVRVRANGISRFLFRQNADFVRKVCVRQPPVIVLDSTQMALFDRYIQIAELQVTVDAVVLEPVTNYLVPDPTELTEDLLDGPAKGFRNRGFAGDPADYLPAVAP